MDGGDSPQNRVAADAEMHIAVCKNSFLVQNSFPALRNTMAPEMKSGFHWTRAFASYSIRRKDGRQYIFSIIVSNYGSAGEAVKVAYKMWMYWNGHGAKEKTSEWMFPETSDKNGFPRSS